MLSMLLQNSHRKQQNTFSLNYMVSEINCELISEFLVNRTKILRSYALSPLQPVSQSKVVLEKGESQQEFFPLYALYMVI